MADNPTMVPVIAPDGSTGTVPQDQLGAAIKAGGKVGVRMLAPDGTPGTIPVDRVHDAIKAGGQLAPPKLTVGGPSSQPMQTMDQRIQLPGQPGGTGAPPSVYQATAPDSTPEGNAARVAQFESEHPVIATMAHVDAGAVKSLGQTLAPGPQTAQRIQNATGVSVPSTASPDLQTQGTAEGVGAGGEGLLEFVMGDAALKGISLAEKLGLAKKLADLAEESPVAARLLRAGIAATRGGVVSGAQSYAHDPSAASAATGAAFGAGGELTGEAAKLGISKLIPRTMGAIDAAAKEAVEEATSQRQTAAREIGNIATRTTGDITGNVIPDADNFRDASDEIRKTFNPTYDKIREATGGVLNKSTGRYSANAFDDATQQIARAKKVIFSPSPASTQALKDAEKELAQGESKLQQLFDSNEGSKSDLQAAKTAWRKAATLDDLHNYIDKAFAEPSSVRQLSGNAAEVDPKKFVRAANKAIDSLGTAKLTDAMGPENFRDLQTLRSQLATRMGEQDYGKSLEQAARKYVSEVGGPSQLSKTAGGPLAGGSVAVLAHLLGASNPATAGIGTTAAIVHWLYTHPDQGVKVLGYVQKAAPLGAQAAKQATGGAVTHIFDPESGEVQPANQ